ncbi:MAG TPA: tRNA (N6-isopentenyl adenosine(37)-C2)-methylthiotransferase MiaB [Candidatus Angelobacter sp.]|nr:tRNA (N6-isopentenyl adenosine(37)-C2)-methylthiotransferase MiaB [Candidatus Angelobacter sp.]
MLSIQDRTQRNIRKLYIESYGCQMNFSDSEIVISLLKEDGFEPTNKFEEADLLFINTCSIREKAEKNVKNRLKIFNLLKKKKPKMIIGMLGCMAERLKLKLLEEEKLVDLIVGPDSYRDIPHLVKLVESKNAINVTFSNSKEETYADIKPVRENGVTAFISITRGCDNMCSFCIVPFTRGRERSRDPKSIIEECEELWKKSYKEITLLGQNVDSYIWYGGGVKKDFHKASNLKKYTSINFAKLLEFIAKAVPAMRIRFSTSNPCDMSVEVLETISRNTNICQHIHLPVQSGSTRVLQRMNRRSTRVEYLSLIRMIRTILPDCSISHDIITGFCGERDQDHNDTLSLMEYVKYDFGYMFAYSSRPGTFAEKNLKDDVPEKIKKRRLSEIIDLQRKHSSERIQRHVGKVQEVLIEGESKKSKFHWYGRNSQSAVVVFPKDNYHLGDLVKVKINDCTAATLIGEVLKH